MSDKLQKIEAQPLDVRRQPTAADMLDAILSAIKSGEVTAEKVAAMDGAMKLCERMQDKESEREFAQAFVRMQSEMRSIKATKPVPNNDGSIRYTFAPFEEIMKEVGPKLEQHGFTVTFSTDFAEGRLIKSCTLTHLGGHSKTNKFSVRIGSGPPKATETQADGAASTYAKRFALCDALNILIEKDSDARAEGGPITAEQAAELEHRLKMLNGDVAGFLKLAGAKKFSEILSGKYDVLDELLKKKEARGR